MVHREEDQSKKWQLDLTVLSTWQEFKPMFPYNFREPLRAGNVCVAEESHCDNPERTKVPE